MKTTLATAAAALLTLLLAQTALAAQQTAPSSEASNVNASTAETTTQASPEPAGTSTVRIVRLSQARGAVQLDRNTGQGFEAAFPNLPITQGARLETGAGFAEVEFEDNSTVRLTPDSLVEFPQLQLLPSGVTATTVNVIKGTVYVSRASTKNNEFTLTFGRQKVIPMPSSHLRLQMEATDAKLAVMDGDVEVADASGQTEFSKKKTLTFNLADQSEPTVAKNVAEDPNDAWDKNSAEYQKQYTKTSAFAGSPYTYGISDLNYYGSFMNFGACGMMWQPYFVSAAWSPFSNGLWAWYPSIGYSWVSPYPWGWMPFHYGAWSYCSGFGWGWMPGGSWIGLGNSALLASGLKPLLPVRAPNHPPLPGQRGLILVNTKPLAVSGMGAHNSFIFRNNSAGLGIPRGSLGPLREFSSGVEHHGSISAPVFVTPLQTGRTAIREANPALRQDGRNVSAGHSGGQSYSQAGSGGRSMGGPSGGGMSGGGGMHGGGTPAGGASAGGGSKGH